MEKAAVELVLTPIDYLWYGGMFILGEALYLQWIAFPAFKALSKSNNKPFSYKEWWECDMNLMIGLNLIPPAVFIGLDQLIGIKPEIINQLKWWFWLLGFVGCTIVFKYLSAFAKGQISLSSVKSNIADIFAGKAITTVRDATEIGTELTGKDVTKTPVHEN